MSILLIRHGETELNAARVVQPADTPLSEKGRRQAQALARRLASDGLAGILCSDLPRALMTAAPVVEATGLEMQVDALLEERNFGELRGRASASGPSPDTFHDGNGSAGYRQMPKIERHREEDAAERVDDVTRWHVAAVTAAGNKHLSF